LCFGVTLACRFFIVIGSSADLFGESFCFAFLSAAKTSSVAMGAHN
jgi:hypothetical protein